MQIPYKSIRITSLNCADALKTGNWLRLDPWISNTTDLKDLCLNDNIGSSLLIFLNKFHMYYDLEDIFYTFCVLTEFCFIY